MFLPFAASAHLSFLSSAPDGTVHVPTGPYAKSFLNLCVHACTAKACPRKRRVVRREQRTCADQPGLVLVCDLIFLTQASSHALICRVKLELFSFHLSLVRARSSSTSAQAPRCARPPIRYELYIIMLYRRFIRRSPRSCLNLSLARSFFKQSCHHGCCATESDDDDDDNADDDAEFEQVNTPFTQVLSCSISFF